ncbi:MAG: CoA ester lyase [Gammaproteobacteria bacterium]|nr:CoA ester lyase [Gammaproteobacteria bacterium]
MGAVASGAADGSPIWRSLLYMPANNRRFIDKAHTRGADGVILDLEDSVPPAARDAARRDLAESVAKAGRAGADVLVRINADGGERESDLDAACIAGVRALVVPKAETAASVRALSAEVAGFEASRRLGPGSIRFLVLIETPAGFFEAHRIAGADPRVAAITLGSEDFAMATGMVPDPENLLMPKQWTLFAARAAGVVPLGLVGSIAGYTDLEAMKAAAIRSRDLGFEGASCIHPSVVPLLNQAFTPGEVEVAAAERIVTAYETAGDGGVGAIELDGKMIDVPVALRARRLLQRAAAIARRDASFSNTRDA